MAKNEEDEKATGRARRDLDKVRERNFRRLLVGVVLGAAVLKILYSLIVHGGLEQTAAMFIGLPTFTALVFCFLPGGPSAVFATVRGTAILLALSGLLLGEGIICILVASPIFLFFGVLIGITVDASRRKEKPGTRLPFILPILLMSLEGVVPGFEFERDDVVSVAAPIEVSGETFFARLAEPLDVTAELPPFLRIGFPRPSSCTGGGVEIGDRRVVSFPAGDLVLEVVDRKADELTFRCIEDGSYIANWMAWEEVTFRRMPDGVSVELSYRRLLDPAWYFKPVEAYAVKRAGEHLLVNFFGAE